LSGEMAGLIRLTKADVKPAAEVLAEAFREYDLMPYFFPDEAKRRKVTLSFVSMALYTGVRYGEVYATSPEMEGVAIWYRPDSYTVSGMKSLRTVPFGVLFSFVRLGGGRMMNVGNYINTVHQRLAPFKHWYLEIIGVGKQFRGQGYAGKLMQPLLSRFDTENVPCYLETLDGNNVPKYSHYGFDLLEETPIPGTTLTIWAMLRKKGR
jgi:ribosomal protein S18 acetylase RimI-like enzyme